MKSWLKCKIGDGQFTGEFTVSGVDFDGKEFSLFVPKEYVRCSEAPKKDETVEGWINVEVALVSVRCLIRLPRPIIGGIGSGVHITVLRRQLDGTGCLS